MFGLILAGRPYAQSIQKPRDVQLGLRTVRCFDPVPGLYGLNTRARMGLSSHTLETWYILQEATGFCLQRLFKSWVILGPKACLLE